MQQTGSFILIIAFIIMGVFGVAWIAGDMHMSVHPCPLGIASATACPSSGGIALLFHHVASAKNAIIAAIFSQFTFFMVAIAAVGAIAIPYIRQTGTFTVLLREGNDSIKQKKLLQWLALRRQDTIPHI